MGASPSASAINNMKKIDSIDKSYIKYKEYMTGKIPSNISDRVLKVWGLKDCETLVFKK